MQQVDIHIVDSKSKQGLFEVFPDLFPADTRVIWKLPSLSRGESGVAALSQQDDTVAAAAGAEPVSERDFRITVHPCGIKSVDAVFESGIQQLFCILSQVIGRIAQPKKMRDTCRSRPGIWPYLLDDMLILLLIPFQTVDTTLHLNADFYNSD